MAQAGSNDEKNVRRKSRWTIPLSNKDGLNNSFWENIHFGRVVVWYGACEVVNQMNINFFQAYSTMYIPSSSLYYVYSSFSLKSSWCKISSAARYGIDSVPQIADDLCLLFCLYPSSMRVTIFDFV